MIDTILFDLDGTVLPMDIDKFMKLYMYNLGVFFKDKIDPKLLAHPANCKLMIHNDNVSKNKKSSITLEELLERIENFKI